MFPFASADLGKENTVSLKFFKSKGKQKNTWHITFIWETFISLKREIYQADSN